MLSDIPQDNKKPSSQILPVQINKIYDLDLDEKSLRHHLIKNNDATIWRWYLRERAHYPKFANQILTKIIRKSKFIQQLHFNCFVQITDRELISLSKSFKELFTLQIFSLSMSDSHKVTPTGLYHFMQGLADLPSLENLNLYIVNCYYLSQKSFNILTQGFRKLVFLKVMTLSFSYCFQISNLEMKSLSQSLEDLVSLRTLSLSFILCNLITDKGILDIRKPLKKLRKLESLHLCFSDSSLITVKGLKSICQSLEGLVHLKKLNFYFPGGCEIDIIDNSGIVGFAISLKKILSLQEVVFVFHKNLKISDAEQELFIEVLKSHSTLKKISVDLGKGLKSFVEEVKNNGISRKALRPGLSYLLAVVGMSLLDRVKLFLMSGLSQIFQLNVQKIR